MNIYRRIINGSVVETEINHIAVRRAVEPREWPFWAKALKMLAAPEDKGIGDVVVRTIGPENSDAFKAWYKKATGKECGCNGRRKLWNVLYPIGDDAGSI